MGLKNDSETSSGHKKNILKNKTEQKTDKYFAQAISFCALEL